MRKDVFRKLFIVFTVIMMLCVLAPCALAAEEEYIPDLTIAQLKKMNGGKLEYTTNSDGYITYLRGNYYDGTVKDVEDVRRALGGVLLLLGGDETTAFSKAVGIEDDNGYKYYSLYQWQMDMPVENAVVKVIVDPEGKTAALSSSLVKGKAADQEILITPEEALKLVKRYLKKNFPKVNYTYYEDQIDKSIISTLDEDGESIQMHMVYVIYTNNPEASVSGNDLPYIAHYVSRAGEYLQSMPVSSRGNDEALKGAAPERTFAGMTAAKYTGVVSLNDGKKLKLTVPVMQDKDGVYYLGDVKRKIAVADCWEFLYNDMNVVLSSSKDNTDWDDKQLLAYKNYILAWDYYAAEGWRSTDGLGTPMLLLANYVDEDKEPVNNACYMGKINGWQSFGATSELNNFCQALDVIGHEFTHGFTTASMTTISYENQYGAINESMSDIMGNIMEMLTGRTDDETWLVGEKTGTAIRCMTDPNAYNQPEYIGDEYYVPDAAVPSDNNDHGGVHINNSLLCRVATKLFDAGMTLEEERALWTTFICGLVPRSDYDDARLMLSFAADITGLDKYQKDISKALEEIRIGNDAPFKEIKDGCGLVTLKVPKGMEPANVLMYFVSAATGEIIFSWPAADAKEVAIVLREGAYAPIFMYFADEGSEPTITCVFDGKGWTADESKIAPMTLEAGKQLDLPTDGISLK